MENFPAYVSLTFILTVAATLTLFHKAIGRSNSLATRSKSKIILSGLMVWLLIQAVLTINNVYNADNDSMPPKILLFGVLPAILLIVFLFATLKGRQFIDSLPLVNITYLNIVRIPVELVLYWLFLNKSVPQLMTFEGRNFDIISGISAPFVAYFGLAKGRLSRQTVLVWNFISLGLLVNIVLNALLSAPSPFQKFAFDQPNVAILNFPISWLPTFVVPVVLFGHLASIRQLMKIKGGLKQKTGTDT